MCPSGHIRHTKAGENQRRARAIPHWPQRGATASRSKGEGGMSRETLAVVRTVLGLAQGAALYLLYNAADAKVWPAIDGQVFAPLALTAVFVPVLGGRVRQSAAAHFGGLDRRRHRHCTCAWRP